jgi:hypothetical protein
MRHAAVLFGIAVAIAAAPAGASITVRNCGSNFAVTQGSTPYSGSIKPGTDSGNACQLIWSPSPFTLGPQSDRIAPWCTVTWNTSEIESSTDVTAGGIRVVYRFTVPGLISWTCGYP